MGFRDIFLTFWSCDCEILTIVNQGLMTKDWEDEFFDNATVCVAKIINPYFRA